MPEYNYKDVIIDPNDPRIEIGKEYYRADFPKRVLRLANNDEDYIGTLEEIDTESPETPFVVKTGGSCSPWACLIRKKEPKKKYVPFNLSNEKDRNRLRGKFLIQLRVGSFTPEERMVVGFSENSAVIGGYEPGCYNGHELLENFTFLDDTPCGQEVES